MRGPIGVIEDPAVTYAAGAPGTGNRLPRHRLTSQDAGESFALAQYCADRYPSAHAGEFLAEATVLAQDLPAPVRRAANAARLDDQKHVFVISGNIVETRLESTPLHWRDADTGSSSTYAFLLALYACLLGDPIGWATQQDGRIITDVLPVRGLEHSLVSSSSATELGWHTEDAFSECRADHVGLFCLRTRDDIPTTMSYAVPAELPPDVVRVLTQRRFHVHPDSSHSSSPVSETAQSYQPSTASPGDRAKVAILSGHPEAPVLRIDRDFTMASGDDTEAAEALRTVVAQLDRNTYEVVLDTGDIGFIDNRNVVHGRRPFRARYDGKDRWLKRVNVVADLRRTRSGRATSATRVVS